MTPQYYYKRIDGEFSRPKILIFYPDGDALCRVLGNLTLNITAHDMAKKICNLLNKEQENDTPTIP
jgi:hypothetical protein